MENIYRRAVGWIQTWATAEASALVAGYLPYQAWYRSTPTY